MAHVDGYTQAISFYFHESIKKNTKRNNNLNKTPKMPTYDLNSLKTHEIEVEKKVSNLRKQLFVSMCFRNNFW